MFVVSMDECPSHARTVFTSTPAPCNAFLFELQPDDLACPYAVCRQHHQDGIRHPPASARVLRGHAKHLDDLFPRSVIGKPLQRIDPGRGDGHPQSLGAKLPLGRVAQEVSQPRCNRATRYPFPAVCVLGDEGVDVHRRRLGKRSTACLYQSC